MKDDDAVEKRSVYLLWHSREVGGGETEDKLLGVYSSREKALARQREAVTLPGFRDFPDDFLIDPYPVDEDKWPEGFTAG